MYARTYACPGATDFFFIYIFSHRSQKGNTQYELTQYICVSFCVYVYVYVYAFLRVWLLQLFFSFVYCSVVSSSLPFHLVRLFSFCPIIIRSLTFSLLDHSTPVLPRIPRFLSLLVALLRLPPSPRSFRVMKIIRRHVRVRGIESYEEEGFEELGQSEGSGEIIVYRYAVNGINYNAELK